METTLQLLFDKGHNDKNENADEVLKNYLFVDESNERRVPDLYELTDDNTAIK